MSTPFQLQVPLTALRWFITSPDAGDPTCLCSWCGKPISEREFPIRMYRELSPENVLEARFHDACCKPVFGVKVQSFNDEPDSEERPYGVSITCLRCGRTSYHPQDIANCYCDNCKQFH